MALSPRRLMRIAIVAACAIVAILIVAAAAIHTPPARRYVLSRALQYLASHDLDVQAQSLQYNLLRGSVDLRDVVVRGRGLPDAPPVARIGRVSLTLGLGDLIAGRYIVRQGAIERPEVHLFVDEQGRTNLPVWSSPDASEEPAAPLTYLIERFALTDARVRYEDRRQQLDLQMPIASLAIDGERAVWRHRARLLAGPGRITLHGREAELDRVDGLVTVDRESLQIDRLDLGAAGSTVSLGGNAIRFADPNYDVAVAARLDVTRLAAFAGFDEPVGGLVRARVKARGPLPALTIETAIDGDDLSFRTLKQMRVGAEATYEAAGGRARVARLDLQAPFGRAQARGLIALDEKAGDSTLEADVAGVDVAALSAALALPYRAASRVEGHVRARWPLLDYARATGDAALTLTPTRPAASRETVPLAGTLTARADPNAIALDIASLRGLGAAVDGRVTLTQRQSSTQRPSSPPSASSSSGLPGVLGGTLRATAADLGAVVSAAEAFLGRKAGTLVGTPVTGQATVGVTLGGSIEAPSARAAIDAPALNIASQPLVIQALAAYTPAAVVVDRADVQWQDARLSAHGRLGLRGRQAIALEATAEGLQIADVLAAAGRADVPATGTIAMQASLGGTVANPSGTASLVASELTLDDEDLGTANVNATVANRRAIVHAVAERFKLTADASIATAAPYATTAELAIADLDLARLPLSDLLPANTPLTGVVRATLTGAGNLTAPADGTATARIDRLDVAWNGQPIAIDGPATARYAGRQVIVDRLIARALDSTVSVQGTLPLDPRTSDGALTLDARLDLATLARYAPASVGLQAQGDLQLAGTIRGSLQRVDPALTLTIAGASIATPALQPGLTDVGARLETADGRLRIADIRAAWGAARLLATGEIPFGWLPADLPVEIPRATGAARLQASLTGLDLATIPGVPGHPSASASATSATSAASVGSTSSSAGSVSAGSADVAAGAGSPAVGPASPAAGSQPTSAARGKPSGTLTGLLSVRADLEADRPDVTAVTGRITFPELRADFSGLTLAQREHSTIALDRGEVRIERFSLDGTVGQIDLSGRASLLGERPIDAAARARLDLGALATFTTAVRTAGQATVEMTARGPAAAPAVRGFAELRDGRVAVPDPQIGAQRLQARVDFTPERITLSRLDGVLNGGTLSGSGSVALDGTTPRDLQLQVKAKDVALDQPLELRSLSDVSLQLTQKGDAIVIGGAITVQEAGLTDDINLDRGLLAALTAPPSLELTEDRNPLLERVQLDVTLKNATPIVVDNNLARAEIDADLRVLGTPYETGLSGRLQLAEGSELILNERRYEVERGIVTFIDDRRIVPSLDLQLKTTARRYDITLAATGTPDDTETTLTSSPSLPEPDILAMLVTGRTLDEMRGEEFEVAQSQVLSYVGGRVGSSLGRGLERATGLSTVRIEPNLIANETDPGARLTVGQDLTEEVSLVYSTDLVNSSDQIWVAEYDVTRQFTTRAVRQSDASYRFDVRHDVRFGGRADPRRARRPTRGTVGTVTIAGQPILPEAEVRDRLGLSTGDAYSFFDLRDGLRRVNELYRDRGWLQARVRPQRVVRGETVDLTLQIAPGPKIDLGFEGYQPSAKLLARLREIWHRGVFETQRADDVKAALREALIDDQYLEPEIEYAIDAGEADGAGAPAGGTRDASPANAPATTRTAAGGADVAREAAADDGARRVTFRVTPGVRFERVSLVFEGARGIDARELEHVIKDQKLGKKVFTNPDEVTDLLRRVYLERGFLSAAIEAPRYAFDSAARHARVTLPVTEGPQFTIRRVTMAGNRVRTTASLLAELPLAPGDPYLPATTERSLTRLRQIYWRGGYNDVKPAYRLAIDREAGVVDVELTVAEGPRSVVAEVNVQGNEKTSQRLVRGELEVKPGEPLDLAALSRSRKNLYEMGAFSLVDIRREEMHAPPAAAASPAASASAAAGAPAAAPATAPTTAPASAPSVASTTTASASTTAPASTAASVSTSAPTPNSTVTSAASVPGAMAQALPGRSPEIPPGSTPVRLDVSVREVQPWQIRYGGLYDTERGPGGILDVSNHNSLGKARVVGLRTRYDTQTREARLYLSQPSLATLPIETIASIYAMRERNPSTARADAFNVDRYGISIQQEKKLRDRYVWSYGYRFERSRTYEPIPDVPRPELHNVAPLTSTLSRDTRDEPLDATQGSFLSQAFSFSPEWLGSDVRYIKYFGQYFRYIPLQAATTRRFTNEVLRPRLVFATGVRLGLANGLAGLDVPLSERFLAGGSTTLRGFAQNAIGPIGADGVPLGGEAMLVINNELRFPLIGIVDGVAFADVGNVFGRVNDFSLTDLRESAGVGLRLRTPWFLVRVDYGVPLDRQPGEARSRAFFSIGQAF